MLFSPLKIKHLIAKGSSKALITLGLGALLSACGGAVDTTSSNSVSSNSPDPSSSSIPASSAPISSSLAPVSSTPLSSIPASSTPASSIPVSSSVSSSAVSTNSAESSSSASSSNPPQTNLALGKVATQVSDFNGDFTADKAVNGSLNDFSTTLRDTSPWWEVDLEGLYQINTIDLHNRASCCKDRLSDFYVFVSADPFVSKDLQETLDQPGVVALRMPGQAAQPTELQVNTAGRYVRVQLVGQNFLHIAEVVVHGSPIPSEVVYAINVGGDAYVASDNTAFSADAFFSESEFLDRDFAVEGTTDDVIYQSERYGDFEYNLPVTTGSYTVELLFTEAKHQAAGLRTFDIWIEDKFVVDDFDIFAAASNQRRRPARLIYGDIEVDDGLLTIAFESNVDNAKLSGIKVTSNDGAAISNNNGGGDNDSDNDGIPDAADQCPNKAGANTSDGCPEADAEVVDLYSAQCLGCHGDENGNGIGVVEAGALTALECDECTTVDELASYIEAEMPPNNKVACDLDCGIRLANYIFDFFEGYEGNLSGEQLYDNLCADCHGDGEQTTDLLGARLVPASCKSCANQEALISRIESSMPTNSPEKCGLECSTKITDYIVNNFEGYEGIASSTTTANLAAPSGSIAFENGTANLSWILPEEKPDSWALERWNKQAASWESIALLPGQSNSYQHADNDRGHYRLYSITNKTASFPAHFRSPSYVLYAKGIDTWGTADEFHFAQVEHSGDFVAEVTLDSVERTHRWTKAGLMIRTSLDANSRNVFALFGVDMGALYTMRLEDGGRTARVTEGDNAGIKPEIKAPGMIRLTRTGNVIKAEARTKDGSWTDLGEQTLDLPETVHVGLALTSNTRSRTARAVFSDFRIDGKAVDDAQGVSIGAESRSVFYPSPNNNSGQIDISPSVVSQSLTHISRFEYANQIADLFPGNIFDLTLPGGDPTSGYEVGINTTTLGVERYNNAAQSIGAAVAAAERDELVDNLDCDPSSNDICLSSYISEIGQRYTRRPVSDELKNILKDVYQEVSANLSDEIAIQAIHEMLAQSSSFLYRFDSVGSGMRPGVTVPVTGYEMATRLASAIWAGAPDAQLLELAEFGLLSTPAQIKAQAQRMVNDAKARRGFRNFYRQWLHLERLAEAEKNIDGVNFDETVAEEMLKGFDAFVEEVVFGSGGGTLNDLLTAPLVGNSNTLASFTGIPSNSNDIVVQSTSGSAGNQRTGIMGQPAMLTNLAHPIETSIVERGVFVNRQLLCAGFQPPPEEVPDLQSIDPDGKRAREVLDSITSDPTQCAFCHKLINDLGATMEHFDALGRYRTEHFGLSIDAFGTVFARDAENSSAQVDGLAELNEYLASLDNVKACIAKQFLGYATQRIPSAAEQPSIDWLVKTLESKDWNLKEMLVEATQTPMFLYKKLP